MAVIRWLLLMAGAIAHLVHFVSYSETTLKILLTFLIVEIEYKPSPFYTPRAQLGLTKPCDSESECAHFPRAKKADKKEAMTQHRHTVDIHLRVSDHSILDEATRDKSLRVMVFCAGEAGPGKQDVAFPHQSEIKVNGGDVKANLRGLKNKPGSTRPVDITNLLRLKPVTYTNTVQMTYALTTKVNPYITPVPLSGLMMRKKY